ncbi:MAG: DNA-processing protein DprA [Ferruginibacter sp.]
MTNDLLYQIALTCVPNIGDVRAKALLQHFETAEAIFRASKKELSAVPNIGLAGASSIKTFSEFDLCENEIAFIEKYHITPLFINDPGYPRRLLNCYDNPILLYYRGTADLNQQKVVAVVGTRTHSDYGKKICEDLVAGLKDQQALIVSGLAFGIDTIAHKAALKNDLETIAVLAHGLDVVYPAQNTALAKQAASNGGLLTEFPSGRQPDKQNFPRRNRIVAGMCDALVVIESGRKGGSLITAELANGYNKDVFALPGRAIDAKSEGCNYLIRQNKAQLISCARDLIESMNWENKKTGPAQAQRRLFLDLSPDELLLTDILAPVAAMNIDDLYERSQLSSSKVAGALLSLEMQGIVGVMPGKMYKLI